MPRPFNLILAITSSRRVYETAVQCRGAAISGGNPEQLEAKFMKSFGDLATDLGFMLVPVDEGAEKPRGRVVPMPGATLDWDGVA